MTSTNSGLVLNIRESGSLFSDHGKKPKDSPWSFGSGGISGDKPFMEMKAPKRVVGKSFSIKAVKKPESINNGSTESEPFVQMKQTTGVTGKALAIKSKVPAGQPQVKTNNIKLTDLFPIPKTSSQDSGKKSVSSPQKTTEKAGRNHSVGSKLPQQEARDVSNQHTFNFNHKKPFQDQSKSPAKRAREEPSPQAAKRSRIDNQNNKSDHRPGQDLHSHNQRDGGGSASSNFRKQNDNTEEVEIWKDGYKSSLFLGNPDIPELPQADIQPVSEKVFSEEGFSALDISPLLVSTLEKLGFKSMTSVQQKTIPAILSGKDALVKSQTGSGKTLSYALPIINNLMMQKPQIQRSDGLLALVIVPTRELALQSYQWFENLCKACVWVVPGYLIGGEKKKAEKARLRKGINILVATSGRLIDHIHNTKSLSLSKVKYLVIDEADRLLEMGYERSVTSIMESLKEQQETKDRQTVMLSATLSSGVEKLAGMSLVSPEVIDMSQEGEDGKLTTEVMATPENLSHNYILVPAKLRLVTLAAFILDKCKVGYEKKIIIFFATQDMVDYHTEIFSRILSSYGKRRDERPSLEKRAERVLAGKEDTGEEEEEEEEDENKILFQRLHGNMTQKERSAVFKSFREAHAGVLMCTDVASRGLDLPRVRWIVQFNAACTAADYVHRVGRTARVNAAGSAVAFLAPAEATYIQMLEKHKIMLNEIKMQEVLRSLKLACDDYTGPNRPSMRSVEEVATNLQMRVEDEVIKDRNLFEMARKAYVSFVRAYASYPKEVRDLFSFKALHLGHYAKSMGLRETPSALGATAAFKAKREFKEKREKKEKRKRTQVMNQKMGQLPKSAMISEFDSGLDYQPLTTNKGKFRR